MKIPFKRDTGFCNHMPYINLQENHKEAFTMIETVCGNFEGYTKRQIERVKLACQVQPKIANPPDERFKQIVNGKTLKN